MKQFANHFSLLSGWLALASLVALSVALPSAAWCQQTTGQSPQAPTQNPQASGTASPQAQANAGADQAEEASSDPAVESEAGDADAADEITVAVSPGKTQRNVPGFWTTLSIGARNPTSKDTTETVAVTIGDRSDMQYARRFWIPAGARRLTWLPARIPDKVRHDLVTIPLTSIRLKETEQGERFEANQLGMPVSKRPLLISRENQRTGVMTSPQQNSPESARVMEEVSEMIYAGRDSAVVEPQDLGVVHLDNGLLPPHPKVFAPFDTIIIASDRVLNDSAATDHLFHWLHSGGRVWVMVNRISPESIAALVGDAMRFSIVDRVEWNAFEHEMLIPTPTGMEQRREKWESERPAELVRVYADTDDVHSRINGWPTAFWVPVGHGEVLFTTLSHNGWLDDQGNVTDTYRTLASRFFVRKFDPPEQAAKLVTFMDKEIGYRIPERITVAAILGGHALIVLLAGLWLSRQRKLHHLAYVIPVAAVIAGGTLVAMGRVRTTAVPSTIATGQIVQAIADSTQVRVEEVAAVYSQETQPLRVASTSQATTELMEQSEGELRRVVWDDSGTSTWQFVKQPPGVVRHVTSDAYVTLETPWSVQGRFTPQGFEGEISGIDIDEIEDAVIVSRAAPSMRVSMSGNAPDTVTATSEDILPRGQYIDAALMTDEQQSRQQLMRDLLPPASPLLSVEPTLMLWTSPIESGVKFGPGFQQRGSALARVPVRLQRLKPGASFTVPAGFLPLQAYAGKRGLSTIYNSQTGTWLDQLDKPAETQLRCLVPPSLLPCELTAADIQIKINAPRRTMTLKGSVNGEFQPLYQQQDVTGTLTYTIDRSDALQLDPEGGLLLAIAISDTQDDEESTAREREGSDPSARDGTQVSRTPWQIDHVYVTLKGVTE